jgi:hypothetical protein
LECSRVRRLARKLSPLYDTLLSPAHRNLQAVMHKNSAKVFSFVDSSGSWRVKSHRGHHKELRQIGLMKSASERIGNLMPERAREDQCGANPIAS